MTPDYVSPGIYFTSQVLFSIEHLEGLRSSSNPICNCFPFLSAGKLAQPNIQIIYVKKVADE
jgi:hypothetical protein